MACNIWSVPILTQTCLFKHHLAVFFRALLVTSRNNMAFAFSKSFYINDSGHLQCENIALSDICLQLRKAVVGQDLDQHGLKELQAENNEAYSLDTPFFVYSKRQITENVTAYQQAFNQESITYSLGYALKANYNPTVVRLMKQLGCWAITVSGNETHLALQAGFAGSEIVFNGNGKMAWEIELALRHNCFLNVDSIFDLHHIISATKRLKLSANILMRLNPNVDPQVHPFLATGLAKSKFGISESKVPEALEAIKNSEGSVNLIGLHCHLGSTIETVHVFQQSLEVMLNLRNQLVQQGINTIRYINLGGGLGINYRQYERRTMNVAQAEVNVVDRKLWQEFIEMVCTKVTTYGRDPAEVLKVLSELPVTIEKSAAADLVENIGVLLDGFPSLLRQLQQLMPWADISVQVPHPSDLAAVVKSVFSRFGISSQDVCVVLEPGRSLIGNTALLLTRTIGVKQNNDKRYIVVDSAMNDVIRPSFYGAYHHIELAEPTTLSSWGRDCFDVVGPVCECGDFLGKDRQLAYPHDGCLLAIFDVGAYCSSMGSNYNMRPRPAEVLVDGDTWTLIRRRDNLNDLLRQYASTT